MTAVAKPAQEPATASSRGLRLESIDILRGLVIALMALDHVRDFWSAYPGDPLDLAHTTPALFLTRWITHICAPTFVLLAGVSASLQLRQGKTVSQLSAFLATRGLWLIVLEMLVVSPSWAFHLGRLNLQVFWAIGWSMLALSAVVWLPRRCVLAAGVLIVAGHDLLDAIKPGDFGAYAPVWLFLHVSGGPVTLAPHVTVFFLYPVLPWIGLIFVGYGLGEVFELEAPRRRRVLMIIGLSTIAAFLALRLSNLYGDPVPWRPQPTLLNTVFSVIAVNKYPPSLLFVLMTVGPALVALSLFEPLRGPLVRVALTFGRTPTFFYLLHLPLIHAASRAVGVAMGFPLRGSARLSEGAVPWGFDLPVVYLVWALVLVALYWPCRAWGDLKRRRKDAWLSYL
jgi:uncharacterized membrane protein